MRLFAGVLSAIVLAVVMPQPSVTAATACDKLTGLTLANTTITLARDVAAGAFTPASEGGADEPPVNARAFSALPAFCRVAATLKPSNDSDIKVELWMPAANWNGKYQAVGNGAFSGSIAWTAMVAPLARGYATSSTDTGHAGNTAGFALGHPEKTVDFGWRAVHEMTVASKAIIAAYYDSGPRLSYWNGCSAGGRQALKEAQRFPADYDGIIAGAPGLDWTGRASQAVRGAQLLTDERARLSPAKAQLLHKAVVDACDALDGLKDGLLADPTRCTFDPAVLQCQGTDEAACLTAPQVKAARTLYSSLLDSNNKRETDGLQRGSELGWTDLGWTASARATGLDQFRFLVFKDASWGIDRFNAQTDLARADAADDGVVNALDVNLKPFIDRGGKLIQYHGWSDPQISPGNSVRYFQRVEQTIGGAAKMQGGYRLFMVPGMGHCRGGEGPNAFDAVAALEQWVEQKKAPDQIVASHLTNGAVDRTRPLCPYPQVARYSGSGNPDDAANFSCKLP
jgi:Tannase and feruloyl esterase